MEIIIIRKKPITVVRLNSTFLTVDGQPSPWFHVKAWLPFRNGEMDYFFNKVKTCSLGDETLYYIVDVA